MKISDYKRSIKAKLSKRIFMNLGIFSSFLLVTLLSLYAWSPAKQSSAFDWSSVDGASPYVASLSGNDEIRISATPSASQAVFAQDDTLELTSTCPYGANIYLNMDSSESNALSRTGSDEGVKTISATTGTSLIDNSWGYSLDNGTTYLPMPLSTGTPVNIYNSEQVESNTEINVKYGMKIDSSIPSGYYSGNVLYSIVTSPACAKYTLSFDTDGGTEIDDVLLTYGQTIDLPDYTTTKQGYVFDGWELVGSMSTTFDGSETDVDVNPGNDLEVELKAKWISPDPMQSFDCTELSIGDVVKLKDTRDGNVYTVKKLADGRCWMTENLRIINKTLTSADSNIISDFTIPASSISGFNEPNTNNAYVDPAFGGYYSFYTATAGWGTNSIEGGSSPIDICPKGWRLPTGGEDGEYNTLFHYYYSPQLMQGEPGFVVSYWIWDGWEIDEGSLAAYWSSTVRDDTDAYTLGFSGDLEEYDYSQNAFEIQGKAAGLAVRCIDKEPTMQTYDTSELKNTGDSIQLIDERDGNKYTVKKLADGNVWMIENLRLIDKTISSADSNLPSGETYTVPASNLASFEYEYNTNSAYLDSTYGAYYDFYTATAGWGTDSVISGNSPKDICPKGWRLPTGDSSGEFQTLYDNYNSSALLQGDPGLLLSGRTYGATQTYRGSYGYFWSSTVSSAYKTYYLRLNSSSVNLRDDDKRYGFSVRCIALSPMQNYDTSRLSNAGDSEKVIDRRDGNIYTVKKLADGNVWMTDNLTISGKTISSSDSNLPAGETYTIPASDLDSFTDEFNTDGVYIDSTYGGYYTFYTATVGWGTTSSTSGSAPKDICPKGWRLPISGDNDELMTLASSYSTVSSLRDAAGYKYGGMIWYKEMHLQGEDGYYWTSTVLDNETALLFNIDDYRYAGSPNINEFKSVGVNIHCIADTM